MKSNLSELKTKYVEFYDDSMLYNLIGELSNDGIDSMIDGFDVDDDEKELQKEIEQIIKDESKKQFGKQFEGRVTDVTDDTVTICYLVK